MLHMGVQLYKHLPMKIKKLDNFNQFRKEVKSISININKSIIRNLSEIKFAQKFVLYA
jgi:cell fate (sporulation/competence/biofilm development) regulator YmcA (YheA/YmcA/DUF963 family)